MSDAMSHAPRCEFPQTIQKTGSPFVVVCGHCHFCRRAHVRRRQAQILSEFENPWNPNDIPSLGRVHWFTMTYSEKHLTHTKPIPHPLGYVVDPDHPLEASAWSPYLGPWPKGEGKKIIVHEGKAYWKTPDAWAKDWPRDVVLRGHLAGEVTASERASMHLEVLRDRWRWTPEQIKEWVNGRYKPLPTLNYSDAQKFIKRVRTNASRAGIGSLRVLIAGEYGDLKARPHYHMTLWGMDLSDIDIVYNAWQAQGNRRDVNFGIMHPTRAEAHLPSVRPATVATPDAGRYQLKDIVKGSRHFQTSPEMMALARPMVHGSARPPLGELTMQRWLAGRIHDQFQRGLDDPLEPCFPDHLTQAVFAVRAVYGQFRLSGEQFPTPLRWKNEVKRYIESLPGGPKAWAAAGKITETVHAERSKIWVTPNDQGGALDDFRMHVESVRNRADELREAHARKIDEKRARYERRTLSARRV